MCPKKSISTTAASTSSTNAKTRVKSDSIEPSSQTKTPGGKAKPRTSSKTRQISSTPNTNGNEVMETPKSSHHRRSAWDDLEGIEEEEPESPEVMLPTSAEQRDLKTRRFVCTVRVPKHASKEEKRRIEKEIKAQKESYDKETRLLERLIEMKTPKTAAQLEAEAEQTKIREECIRKRKLEKEQAANEAASTSASYSNTPNRFAAHGHQVYSPSAGSTIKSLNARMAERTFEQQPAVKMSSMSSKQAWTGIRTEQEKSDPLMSSRRAQKPQPGGKVPVFSELSEFVPNLSKTGNSSTPTSSSSQSLTSGKFSAIKDSMISRSEITAPPIIKSVKMDNHRAISSSVETPYRPHQGNRIPSSTSQLGTSVDSSNVGYLTTPVVLSTKAPQTEGYDVMRSDSNRPYKNAAPPAVLKSFKLNVHPTTSSTAATPYQSSATHKVALSSITTETPEVSHGSKFAVVSTEALTKDSYTVKMNEFLKSTALPEVETKNAAFNTRQLGDSKNALVPTSQLGTPIVSCEAETDSKPTSVDTKTSTNDDAQKKDTAISSKDNCSSPIPPVSQNFDSVSKRKNLRKSTILEKKPYFESKEDDEASDIENEEDEFMSQEEKKKKKQDDKLEEQNQRKREREEKKREKEAAKKQRKWEDDAMRKYRADQKKVESSKRQKAREEKEELKEAKKQADLEIRGAAMEQRGIERRAMMDKRLLKNFMKERKMSSAKRYEATIDSLKSKAESIEFSSHSSPLNLENDCDSRNSSIVSKVASPMYWREINNARRLLLEDPLKVVEFLKLVSDAAPTAYFSSVKDPYYVAHNLHLKIWSHRILGRVYHDYNMELSPTDHIEVVKSDWDENVQNLLPSIFQSSSMQSKKSLCEMIQSMGLHPIPQMAIEASEELVDASKRLKDLKIFVDKFMKLIELWESEHEFSPRTVQLFKHVELCIYRTIAMCPINKDTKTFMPESIEEKARFVRDLLFWLPVHLGDVRTNLHDPRSDVVDLAREMFAILLSSWTVDCSEVLVEEVHLLYRLQLASLRLEFSSPSSGPLQYHGHGGECGNDEEVPSPKKDGENPNARPMRKGRKVMNYKETI